MEVELNCQFVIYTRKGLISSLTDNRDRYTCSSNESTVHFSQGSGLRKAPGDLYIRKLHRIATENTFEVVVLGILPI